ncbi:MAG: ATP-binding protein [Spirochaetota bacterium]
MEKQNKTFLKEKLKLGKKEARDEWVLSAIESRDFYAYHLAIMHDWLRTLVGMASVLVPLFFILDIILMPAVLLSRFAIYRAVSTLIAIIQIIIIYKTKPSLLSYLHGYFLSFHVGGVICLMTADLGGFSSSYYAGLNLVIIGANLLMPWKARHTFFNSSIIILMYVAVNLAYNNAIEISSLLNNLFFLSGTTVLSIGINFVRFRLMKNEFNLLVDLEEIQDDLKKEKEKVEERTASLKSLLDVSGQGFLSFDSNFIISPEYSRECAKIFGQEIEGQSIDAILFNNPETRNEFKKGLSLCFKGAVKPDVIFDHLDNTLKIADRTFNIVYKAVHSNRVMVVLSDITEEIRLQEESRKENEKWNLIRKVIINRQSFAVFDREAKTLFTELKNKEKGFESLLPDLHTLKGNAGFLGFKKTHESAHMLEDFLSSQFELDEEVHPKEQIENLMTSFAEEMADVTDTLGMNWRLDVDVIEIPKSEYLLIKDHIITHCPNPALTNAMDEHRKKPLPDLFAKIPKMAEEIAKRLGKRIAPVRIIGGNINVVPDDFEELIESFSHIIRNSIDHGIDHPPERKKHGKPLTGSIKIEIENNNKKITFHFSDDGKGIQFKKIAERAKQLGFIKDKSKPTESELLSYIFRDNFSTSPTVSHISGRGVGLAAVRHAVKKMDGHIKVKTSPNKGTIFSITIPINQMEQEEMTA